MLILDTETLDPAERADAFQAAVSGASSSNLARFEDPAAVRARLDLFDFGPGRVFNVRATGNTLLRTQKIARGETEQAIALALPVSGQNRLRWDREERLLDPRDMLLVDLASPYEYGWHGTGSSYAFQVDFDRLGLGMDTIRAAWPRLDATPLYPVVRDHILHVTTHAEQLSADGGADDIDDGVDRADFVEVNFLNGDGMDGGFGFAEELKGADGAVFGGIGERGGADDLKDRGEGTMGGVGVVRMF